GGGVVGAPVGGLGRFWQRGRGPSRGAVLFFFTPRRYFVCLDPEVIRGGRTHNRERLAGLHSPAGSAVPAVKAAPPTCVSRPSYGSSRLPESRRVRRLSMACVTNASRRLFLRGHVLGLLLPARSPQSGPGAIRLPIRLHPS